MPEPGGFQGFIQEGGREGGKELWKKSPGCIVFPWALLLVGLGLVNIGRDLGTGLALLAAGAFLWWLTTRLPPYKKGGRR